MVFPSDKISGVQDSSGITLHITSNIRKYDAGILELGLEYNNKMAVPPG
jgi:dopamine beta-monooxygenase